jgi:SAM-dependent methyltransferase
MATSLIYRNALLYETAMRALYGRHYWDRYRAVDQLVANDVAVLDVCCGPATIYFHFLKSRGVHYTGLDISPYFVQRLRRKGVAAQVWDVAQDRPLPEADFVLLQASLYHFLPKTEPIVDRLVKAAKRAVIIAEPIRNLATSRSVWLSWCGRHLTNAGQGPQTERFTSTTLDQLLLSRADCLHSFLIPGGREKIFVLGGAA